MRNRYVPDDECRATDRSYFVFESYSYLLGSNSLQTSLNALDCNKKYLMVVHRWYLANCQYRQNAIKVRILGL